MPLIKADFSIDRRWPTISTLSAPTTLPMHRIGFIGNVVGALKVEIVGHRRSIEKSALIKGITGLLK